MSVPPTKKIFSFHIITLLNNISICMGNFRVGYVGDVGFVEQHIQEVQHRPRWINWICCSTSVKFDESRLFTKLCNRFSCACYFRFSVLSWHQRQSNQAMKKALSVLPIPTEPAGCPPPERANISFQIYIVIISNVSERIKGTHAFTQTKSLYCGRIFSTRRVEQTRRVLCCL